MRIHQEKNRSRLFGPCEDLPKKLLERPAKSRVVWQETLHTCVLALTPRLPHTWERSLIMTPLRGNGGRGFHEGPRTRCLRRLTVGAVPRWPTACLPRGTHSRARGASRPWVFPEARRGAAGLPAADVAEGPDKGCGPRHTSGARKPALSAGCEKGVSWKGVTRRLYRPQRPGGLKLAGEPLAGATARAGDGSTVSPKRKAR